jgi:hypothetical protein
MSASRNGHTDIVVELLEHNDVDVNLQDRNWFTRQLYGGRANMAIPTLLSNC